MNNVLKAFLISTILLLSLLVLTASVTSLASDGSSSCGDKSFYYMFGASWCPHCRALHSFFDTYFKGEYYVCYIDQDVKCKENFIALWSELLANETTARLSVPTTLVIRENKTITAIVVGEIRSSDFWSQLACLNATDSIPYYVGDRVVSSITINTTDHRALLQRFIYIGEAKANSGSNIMPVLLIPLVVFLPIAVYIAYSYVKKK